MTLFSVSGLTMRFGGVTAVDGLNLSVEKGEIRGLNGPNGAGKTTIFNMISGVYKPTHGQIHFGGEDIAGLPPYRIARKGLIRTFQAISVFKRLTVMDNVRIGSHLSAHGGFGATLLGRGEVRQTEKAIDRRAEEILELVGLTGHMNDEASTLAHGHQRALGIAVALAAKPKMLMLDEPCAGMNIGERVAMMALIKKIRDQDVTLMLVEHDMKVIMAICDSITVVSFGKLIAEGTPDEVRENPVVHEAYLGRKTDAA